MDIKKLTNDIIAETKKIIVGKDDRIKLVMMAVLAGGHVLIEDLPGVGKTTLAKTISAALGLSTGRIQFVPDLLPSDITGMNIFNQKTGEFELRKGPVMVNILLADEINRAIPRTQSALLEAMEERQVTIDGQVISLPSPFIVLATQNPIESESTFRLPAAQMDRFLIEISMGYPSSEEEKNMLKMSGDGLDFSIVNAVADPGVIGQAISAIDEIYVSEEVMDYIISITKATRQAHELQMGAGPRATKALYRSAKVWAAMDGRDFVIPDDVKSIALPVLAHRLIFKSSYRGMTAQELLEGIIENTEASVLLTPES